MTVTAGGMAQVWAPTDRVVIELVRGREAVIDYSGY